MLRRTGMVLAVLLLLGACDAKAAGTSKETAYDFQFESIEGGPLALSDYRGKALLVVNTASHCGFTPQYKALESLWKKYRDRGLVVVGVPSNDFGQEKGSAKEIKEFCESYFGVDFPLADSTVIKGKDAHPFYRWAETELGHESVPRWNFYKYLVGRDGRLLAWFPSDAAPEDPKVIKAIEAALP